MGEVLWSLFITLLFLFGVYYSFRIRAWFLDYYFNAYGIQFVLFGGRVPVGIIKREQIETANVVPLFDISRPERLSALSLPNRFVSRIVLVKTNLPIRLWILTPAHPEQSIEALGWKED